MNLRQRIEEADAANREEVAARLAQREITMDAIHVAPWSYPACNGGPCRGGRALCPTPEACQLQTDSPEDTVDRALGFVLDNWKWFVGIATVLWAALCFWAIPHIAEGLSHVLAWWLEFFV